MELMLIFVALAGIGSMALQVFFSLGKRRLLYFLLPALNFIASLAMQVNLYVHHVPGAQPAYYELFMFLGQNALTAVLLLVHFAVRWWKRRKDGINRMNARDIDR